MRATQRRRRTHFLNVEQHRTLLLLSQDNADVLAHPADIVCEDGEERRLETHAGDVGEELQDVREEDDLLEVGQDQLPLPLDEGAHFDVAHAGTEILRVEVLALVQCTHLDERLDHTTLGLVSVVHKVTHDAGELALQQLYDDRVVVPCVHGHRVPCTKDTDAT